MKTHCFHYPLSTAVHSVSIFFPFASTRVAYLRNSPRRRDVLINRVYTVFPSSTAIFRRISFPSLHWWNICWCILHILRPNLDQLAIAILRGFSKERRWRIKDLWWVGKRNPPSIFRQLFPGLISEKGSWRRAFTRRMALWKSSSQARKSLWRKCTGSLYLYTIRVGQ